MPATEVDLRDCRPFSLSESHYLREIVPVQPMTARVHIQNLSKNRRACTRKTEFGSSRDDRVCKTQPHTDASNRFIALWTSIIGKKIVMALTGAVLILFVLAHMAGNLKIFSGPEEINAYSRFLARSRLARIRLRPIAVDGPHRALGLRVPAHHRRLSAHA